jgi:hypothetical protein
MPIFAASSLLVCFNPTVCAPRRVRGRAAGRVRSYAAFRGGVDNLCAGCAGAPAGWASRPARTRSARVERRSMVDGAACIAAPTPHYLRPTPRAPAGGSRATCPALINDSKHAIAFPSRKSSWNHRRARCTAYNGSLGPWTLATFVHRATLPSARRTWSRRRRRDSDKQTRMSLPSRADAGPCHGRTRHGEAPHTHDPPAPQQPRSQTARHLISQGVEPSRPRGSDGAITRVSVDSRDARRPARRVSPTDIDSSSQSRRAKPGKASRRRSALLRKLRINMQPADPPAQGPC